MGALNPAATIILGALFLAGTAPRLARSSGAGTRGTRSPVEDSREVGGSAAAADGLLSLTIRIRDAQGAGLAARLGVTGSDGRARPAQADAALMSHSGLGGYFYTDSVATVQVPAGSTRVVVSRGFEYRPVVAYLAVGSDTVTTITLERLTDLRPGGWYCGDLHAHARHPPLDYDLSPAQVRLVAEAEGLSVLHPLDQSWEFTGAPHALSDSVTSLYFSYEYRNQTFGHVSLPGLRSPLGEGCCVSPAQSAYPMLMDLAAQVHAQAGAGMVLAHPHSTDDYDLLDAWPGMGLGRELPVLAALGGLDAVDLASYSNEPDLDVAEWFQLLSAGFAIPPSAGTDAVLNWYSASPPGGWRVYARQEGSPFDYGSWLTALEAGRCFVTGGPLVPEFSLGGSGPGETLEVAGDSLVAPLHLETLCAVGLSAVQLVADGVGVWSRSIPASPVTYALDTTFVLRMARPGWVALCVSGMPRHPATASGQPVAYTNAVRILHDGAPVRRPAAMVYWLGRVDSLMGLLVSDCSWSASWQRDTVLARVSRARQFYVAPFRTRPADFTLESPLCGDTARTGLSWSEAVDPDTGDVVTYVARVGTDSTLAGALQWSTTGTSLTELPLAPGRQYWWSVEASDIAGNVTVSTPGISSFIQPGLVDVGEGGVGAGVPPRARPNPSRGAVVFEGLGADVAVYDLAGRCVAERGRGISRGASGAVWDGLDRGGPAAPGVYLARSAGTGRTLRIVRLR